MKKVPDKAWKVIESRKNWTQNTLARDSHSKPCDEKSPYAVRWCAIGAIYLVYNVKAQKRAMGKIREILEQKGGLPYLGTVVGFNDSHTHTEVVALLKEANV